ncbi:GDSL-type esterase/lipase family protein [Thermoproteota archaeon]
MRVEKKILGFIAVLFGLILILVVRSCSLYPIANIGSQGENVICFGDSITRGANVVAEKSYPSLLSKLLGREVINAGVGGDTTASAIRRLDRDVLERDPLLVVVILGGNDFLTKVPREKTFKNLEFIVKSIKAQGAIVVLGQLGPINMSGYRHYYKELARQEGAFLIKDLLSGIFANPSMMSDHIHPNEKGYEEMCERVYNAIKSILAQNQQLRGNL